MDNLHKRRHWYHYNYRRVKRELCKLGLPDKLLLLLVTSPTALIEEVERAQKMVDALNARLDEWEEQNPAAAALAPWRDARQAWKDAGRPRAEWYELVKWSMPLSEFARRPMKGPEIERGLLNTQTNRVRAKLYARGLNREGKPMTERGRKLLLAKRRNKQR